MRIQFIDEPHYTSRKRYDDAVHRMVERLIKLNDVVSIYQIGSISTPGISDIDMVVLFCDSASCGLQPLHGLPQEDSYLFIHNLFGGSQSLYAEACRYTFFHNYHLLWGSELGLHSISLPNEEDKRTLKRQIALEYLLKAYITFTTQIVFKIVKLRSLLLEIKALQYDLEFLDVRSGQLYDLVQEFIHWRNHWFDSRPNRNQLRTWLHVFYSSLEAFLQHTLNEEHLFYVPTKAEQLLGPNILMLPGEPFRCMHTGFTLPPVFRFLGRKYFNIQYRFHRFSFYLPAETPEPHTIVHARFAFLKKMKAYNQKFLPHFAPLTSSLNLI